MPDFNHSLNIFTGRESSTEARTWLNSIESVAKLHNWPDSFKLETVRAKLDGPSRNWYVSRTFSNWHSFVDQFTNTFIGHELCTVDRVKAMSNRIQLKDECIIEYFHHKVRLCREIQLPFNEVKRQVIEGIYSHDMCNYLMARTDFTEDELLSDINSFNDLRKTRSSRVRPTDTAKTKNNQYNTILNRKVNVAHHTTDSQSTSYTNPRQSRDMTNIRCHRCGAAGHIAPSCTVQVKQNERRLCFRCHSQGHVARNCPQNTAYPFQSTVAQLNNPGDNVSILENPPLDVVPPYTIYVKIMFPNGNFSNINALIDTGSPVSLLKSAIVSYTTGIIPPPSDLVGINGSRLKIIDEFLADLHHDDLDRPINIKFRVVPDNTIRTDCLLGRNFLSHPRVNLNVVEGEFVITFKQINPYDEILSVDYGPSNRDEFDIDLDVDHTLPNNILTTIKDIYINNYVKHTTQCSDNNRPEIHIQLKNHRSFYFRPRRLSFYEKEKLQTIIDDLLKKNIIRPSTSEYSSPIILVKKKMVS